jgi:hypothetical protein
VNAQGKLSKWVKGLEGFEAPAIQNLTDSHDDVLVRDGQEDLPATSLL